jgi:signal transduction histidine kinase
MKTPRVTSLAVVGWSSAAVSVVALAPLTGPGTYVPALTIAVAFLAAGTVATRWRSNHLAATWLLAAGVAHTTAFALTGVAQWASSWLLAVVAAVVYAFGFVAYLGLLATFPDGTYQPRWTRWAVKVAGFAALCLPPLGALARGEVPLVLEGPGIAAALPLPVSVPTLQPVAGLVFALFLAPLFGVAATLVRYRRAGGDQREKMRWPLVAAIFAGTAIALSLFGVLPGDAVAVFALGAFPAALLIGMARHRLFDVDLVIVRGLVVGVLSIAVAAVYLGIAGWLGVVAGDHSSLRAGVLVALLASVLFQPARQWLERRVDGWIRGKKPDPFAHVVSLSAELERQTDYAVVRRVACEQVRAALSAPWVTIQEPGGEGHRLSDAGLVLPLQHGGDLLGTLLVGPRLDTPYGGADRELLAALGVPIALALRTNRLTRDLAERVDELATSRRRLVQAQEDERRRIERDLHDGIQQDLIAIMVGVEVAHTRIASDRPGAAHALEDVRRLAKETHRTLRRLVHGIYPSVLTDQGIVAAIEARLTDLPIGVSLNAADQLRRRRYPPAFEGAIYFIVVEALTNVIKHADAAEATVTLSETDGRLQVEVRDMGVGFDTGVAFGSGLRGLADRIGALEGELAIDSRPGSGTLIRASLPNAEVRRA